MIVFNLFVLTAIIIGSLALVWLVSSPRLDAERALRRKLRETKRQLFISEVAKDVATHLHKLIGESDWADDHRFAYRALWEGHAGDIWQVVNERLESRLTKCPIS